MGATYASAGGSAVVGTNVTYSRKGAVVGSPGAHKSTTVYIPITNPQSQTDKLTKVSVECNGTNATAKELFVYFGNTLIFDATVPDGSKDFDALPNSSSSLPDANPYGIDVSIDLDFSSENGTFEIYSVTLQFGS